MFGLDGLKRNRQPDKQALKVTVGEKMKEQVVDENRKAIIIEIMDVFYAMDVEEIPEDYPEEKEFEAHLKVINEVLRKAKAEGYKKYKLLSADEVKNTGSDIGINGLYLVLVRK